MKTHKIKVIIKDSDDFKDGMLQALSGNVRRIQKDHEIYFNSVKAFTQILTANRIEILIYLNRFQPKSIYDLAKGLRRDFKNVHTDVKKLADLGLIELEEARNSRNGLIPRAKYSGIELKLAA